MVIIRHHIPGRIRFRIEDNSIVGLSDWLRMGLMGIQGVRAVRINEAASSVSVNYDPEILPKAQIEERFNQLDWSQATFSKSEHHYTRGDIALNVTGLLAATLIPAPYTGLVSYPLIADTLEKGLSQLYDGKIGTDVLDALAITLSAARGDHSTAMLTQSLLSAGEYMEQQTSRNSDALLSGLMQPQHSEVWVRRNETEQQVSSASLVVGDIVLLGPGDTVPADGTTIKGSAFVNQASLTGESVPVRREEGCYLYAGTIIQDGHLELCIEKVGSETTTSRIRSIIAQSLSEKSQTQLATAEMAERRTRITLAIGAAVFALTRDVKRLAAVFLVDYSCALKLSTPVTFKSVMYRAARQGLLLKGGRAIENIAQVDTCVFDKTGTLTYGDFEVTDVICLREHKNARELLAMAASVEEHSNHPLAQAIVNMAKNHELPHIEHGEIEYVIAHGLKSSINQMPLLIGSRHYLEAHENIDFTPIESTIKALEQSGKHMLFIASENQLIGIIALRDTLRSETVEALKALRQSGIKKLVLLTGDTAEKARQLADELGFDEWIASATPDSKAEVVRNLQQQGHRVLFVGDGINDAPALSQADVGASMATGTDLAYQTADMVLLNDNLLGLPEARKLASEAVSLIHSNIKLAERTNSGIMFFAAMGYLSPALSALMHNGTTLAIISRAIAARYN